MQSIKTYFGRIITTIILALLISAINISAATFIVTNTNDSGAGSLREAVNQANANAQADTINFDPAVFSLARTITLTSGEIRITADDQIANGQTGRLVTINGPGANLLTISGNNSSRIFLLYGTGTSNQNANVTMNGMTLRDGTGISTINSNNGGAIYANLAANLTLNSMVIRNNTVVSTGTDNGIGGGIYINGSRQLVYNNTLITENTALSGGGVYSGSDNNTVTMLNTIVSNNNGTNNSGGMSIFRGTHIIKNCQFTGNRGGNIGGLNFFQANIDMSDSVISNNMAGITGAGFTGGISTDGGAVVTFRRVTISNNSSRGAYAGGIYVRNPSGVVTLIDSTVSNNAVLPVSGSGDVNGGGIYSISGAPFRIINTTISGNSAGGRGGGIANDGSELLLINSTVVNNSAGNAQGGGGIFDVFIQRSGGSFGNTVKLQNSIIANNTAPVGPDLNSRFTSNGYNIIGNTASTGGSVANTGDKFNVNPQIAALADNGGPTQTHALLAASPAINAGSNALAVDQNGNLNPFDQRGACYERFGGGTVDIGAFETGATAACNPSRFDFDGDGRDDVSVFRPSNGVWYLQQSTVGFVGIGFGISTDKIVPADYDGDGKTDLAVYRGGTWYLNRSQFGFTSVSFGTADDIPVPADYDGDGRADVAVFRPGNGTWYLLRSQLGFIDLQFGQNGDKPVAADYDGDGKADLAVNRGGIWYVQRSQLGFFGVQFGEAADRLVPADYDGDGKADIAVFRSSNGTWYIQQSSAGFAGIQFGQNGDLPSTADYDGDGKTDVAVFRNGTWYVNRSTQGFTGIQFGTSTDVPIPNALVR